MKLKLLAVLAFVGVIYVAILILRAKALRDALANPFDIEDRIP